MILWYDDIESWHIYIWKKQRLVDYNMMICKEQHSIARFSWYMTDYIDNDHDWFTHVILHGICSPPILHGSQNPKTGMHIQVLLQTATDIWIQARNLLSSDFMLAIYHAIPREYISWQLTLRICFVDLFYKVHPFFLWLVKPRFYVGLFENKLLQTFSLGTQILAIIICIFLRPIPPYSRVKNEVKS